MNRSNSERSLVLFFWTLCLVLAAIPWILPPPSGLTPSSWIYAGLCVAVLLGLVLRPAPPSVVALLGVLAASVIRIGPTGSDIEPLFSHAAPDTLRWAFSGFASPLVWIIFAVSQLGLAFEKTGLGIRLGHALIQLLGKKTLGLGYAIALCEGFLAVIVPSPTARSGGIIRPLILGIPPLCRSGPEAFPRTVGAYLCWVAFAASCVTSSLFLTAFIPNLISLDILRLAGLAVPDWKAWFLTAAPCGIFLLLIIPLLTYWIYPPEQKILQIVPHAEDGSIPRSKQKNLHQSLLLVFMALAIAGWIVGEPYGITIPIVSLIVVLLLVLTGILEWSEVTGNVHAWNLVLWLGAMLSLTAGLDNMGVLDCLVNLSLQKMQGCTPNMYLIALVVLFFFSRYFMAGADLSAAMLMPLFLAAGSALSGMTTADLSQLGMMLLFVPGLSSVLTPYASGQGMIWLSTGYIRQEEFWFLGLIFGIIFLAILLAVTMPWVYLYGNVL